MAKITLFKALSDEERDNILKDIIKKEKCLEMVVVFKKAFCLNDLRHALTSRGISFEPKEINGVYERLRSIAHSMASYVVREIADILEELSEVDRLQAQINELENKKRN